MNDLKARVAYLQGLSAGIDMGDTKEGMLFKGIIDVLGDFAETVDSLEQGQEQLEDYLDSLDEDLYSLESDIYEEDDLYPNGNSNGHVEADCPGCNERVYFNEDLINDDDIEVACPSCDDVVYSKHMTHTANTGNENAHYNQRVETEDI